MKKKVKYNFTLKYTIFVYIKIVVVLALNKYWYG